MKRYLTDKQLKEMLGNCSSMTLWRLRRDGKLPTPRKLGNRNITPEEEADKAIAALLQS
jgi:predicted DNA-binding transcriptional regulator AlpA